MIDTPRLNPHLSLQGISSSVFSESLASSTLRAFATNQCWHGQGREGQREQDILHPDLR